MNVVEENNFHTPVLSSFFDLHHAEHNFSIFIFFIKNFHSSFQTLNSCTVFFFELSVSSSKRMHHSY